MAGFRELQDHWAAGPGPRREGWWQRFGRLADDWGEGRLWWPRLPLLAYMAWLSVRFWNDPSYQPLLKGLDLGVHELGHMLWSPFGQFMSILGGSLTQCLLPLVGTWFFLRQRDLFAICFASTWLGANLHDVATYCADARDMELPLVSPFAGDEIIHDWNWLLENLGWLQHDQTIASGLHVAGHLLGGAGLGLGAYLLWRMARSGR